MAVGLDTRPLISVARQPILDRRGQIFGHELLYRHSPDATSCRSTSDAVGAEMLSDAVLSIGLDVLTSGRPAFINLTHRLLLEGAGGLLPREVAVLEIREDIPADDNVIEQCRQLHTDGYMLALDDFTPDSPAEALLPFARYVKIDVLQIPSSQWKPLVQRLGTPRRQLVAEKVETSEVAAACLEAGFHLFQGYYFCKPMNITAERLPSKRLAYLELLGALSRPDLSLTEIEDLVKRDVSLSYRVLRAINSAGYALQREVTSIRSALVLLGLDQIRKWACVWALAGLSGGESPGAVSLALVRARCCERIGEMMSGPETDGYFLLGLCSLLDAMLRRPMAVALNDLPLPANIRDALLGADNPARMSLEAIVAYERGEWDKAIGKALEIGVNPGRLWEVYADGLRWSAELSEFSLAS